MSNKLNNIIWKNEKQTYLPAFMTRMRAAVLIFRALLMALGLAFGLWGVGAGLMAVQFYMVSLRSFGVPVMYGTLYHPGTGHEDTVTRPPFFKMKKRGRFLARNGGNRS